MAIYNQTAIEKFEKRKDLLKELLGSAGEDSYIEPPFFCDYGKNIFVGSHFYANYGCAMVDTGNITIGDHVWIGYNTTINPDVVIGKGSVIGSGFLVTHDIPANAAAAGNPCKVLRKIKENV